MNCLGRGAGLFFVVGTDPAADRHTQRVSPSCIGFQLLPMFKPYLALIAADSYVSVTQLTFTYMLL